jgi:parallel beta-helix repeat protein
MLHTKNTRQIVKLAAGVFVFIGLVAMVPNPAWATDITKCGAVIDQPGDYHLAQDLTCNPGLDTAAITIHANDVTLHLGGHTLSGGGTGINGIVVGFGSGGPMVFGVTIQGGTVTNFVNDVILSQVGDSKVVNVDAVDTVATNLQGDAIALVNSNDNSIINCTASGSSFVGIELFDSNDNTRFPTRSTTMPWSGFASCVLFMVSPQTTSSGPIR